MDTHKRANSKPPQNAKMQQKLCALPWNERSSRGWCQGPRSGARSRVVRLSATSTLSITLMIAPTQTRSTTELGLPGVVCRMFSQSVAILAGAWRFAPTLVLLTTQMFFLVSNGSNPAVRSGLHGAIHRSKILNDTCFEFH